jgi:hypothetical protein
MEIYTAVYTAVGVSTLVTFGGTKLWDAYRMEKKFRSKSAAEKCMKEREQAENDLKAILKRVEKRLQLGNLAIGDLWEKAELPPSKLLMYEKALDIKLRDENEIG